jgi:hypothetical protein
MGEKLTVTSESSDYRPAARQNLGVIGHRVSCCKYGCNIVRRLTAVRKSDNFQLGTAAASRRSPSLSHPPARQDTAVLSRDPVPAPMLSY